MPNIKLLCLMAVLLLPPENEVWGGDNVFTDARLFTGWFHLSPRGSVWVQGDFCLGLGLRGVCPGQDGVLSGFGHHASRTHPTAMLSCFHYDSKPYSFATCK